MKKTKSELLAPAGDFKIALAAFAAGADAVYCGLADFSARAFAQNLTIDELKALVAYAHANGKKVYVTFNTLIDEDDIESAVRELSRLESIGPDALIVQDLGVARICRRYFPSLQLHASTQMVAHNLEGVLELRDLGFSRVVLARELSLQEIASISKRCGDVELECFIHGALCYSVSGLCLFGAMEKGRSGNRGKCPYCCRLTYEDAEGHKNLAFSMKDMRVGADVSRLVDAGIASLKIEGRMKSELYVASVTRYYRQLLDDNAQPTITIPDLETVFSRRTTQLYLNGRGEGSVIDSISLGHVGTPIGKVKRITKDRDGVSWLRFHTARALEKHDGLQFESVTGGKSVGMGIAMMRLAISRHPIFEVPADSDVEVMLPENAERDLLDAIKPGKTVYCSMSNAVKRALPSPNYRPSDYAGRVVVNLKVSLKPNAISVAVNDEVRLEVSGEFESAKNPEKTFEAVKRAFSKLGGTDYVLGELVLDDPDKRFAPLSVLNDLRRDLVERMDDLRNRQRQDKVVAALSAEVEFPATVASVSKTVKLRLGQKLPAGNWDEKIIAVSCDTDPDDIPEDAGDDVRMALPVWTSEPQFNRLRILVKGLIRRGFVKWEASDLATLRMLKECGVDDITADWTLYAFNSRSLATLWELGVRRFVASPENNRENLQYLAESGYPVEFLAQQSTPLFISLTKPECGAEGRLRDTVEHREICVFKRDGVWVTTRPTPRVFEIPDGVPARFDLSWNVEE